MRLVLLQKYFTFQNKIYKPEKDVSMGSLISSTIAEIFLHHFEDICIKQLLDTKNIIFYTRYIDDVLIVYDTTRKTTDFINTHVNQMNRDIKLNTTYENNRCISFLDLLIILKTSNLEIDI